MPLLGGLASKEQVEYLSQEVHEWLSASQYAVASTDPRDALYEPQRYWRGPVWLHINWLIAIGCEDSGDINAAKQIKDKSEILIRKSKFYEYFNADTGVGCGGNDFSWTAAIAMYWLLKP